MQVLPPEWQYAKSLFLENPDSQKIKRDLHSQLVHSFICFEGKILALASNQDEFKYLGEGIYGRVKLAQDKEGRLYVLKIQKTKHASHQNVRFFQFSSEWEARVAYDVGAASKPTILIRNNGKKTYILYHYLGMPLQSYLEKHLTIEQRYDIAVKIAFAVYRLHSGKSSKENTSYTHLDIKPHNMVIDDKACVHLIDYGCSDYVGSINRSDIKGARLYVPKNPIGILFEQIDVFSLLRTLYIPQIVYLVNRINRDAKPDKMTYQELIKQNPSDPAIGVFSDSLATENPCLHQFLDTTDSEIRTESALQVTAVLILAKYGLLSESNLYSCLNDFLDVAEKIVALYEKSHANKENSLNTHSLQAILSPDYDNAEQKSDNSMGVASNKSSYFSLLSSIPESPSESPLLSSAPASF